MTPNMIEALEIAITFDGEPPTDQRVHVLYPETIDQALAMVQRHAKPWDIPVIWTRKTTLHHTPWQEWDH